MKIEVAVAAWGFWADRWRNLNYPVMRAEADDVGASLVVYTDDAGREQLAGDRIDEFRPLPEAVSWFDQADGAHADAIDRALAGDHAVAPLCASLRPGRGTMAAAARRLEAGYRACMALCIPGGVPDEIETAAEMSRRLGAAGAFGWWANRTTTTHPGHYGWRSSNGAALVRPIYHHPILLRPTRAHSPRRAADHFMTEGYLDDIAQVAQLEPLDGCIRGLPSNDHGAETGPPRPHENPALAEPEGIVNWMLSRVGVDGGFNAMPWNLYYMAHRFWCGEPGADRLEVEVESDRAIAEIRRIYFERVGDVAEFERRSFAGR